MEVLRAAGARPLARATAAGVAATMLVLLVLVRGLLEVIDPVSPEVAAVGAGLLVVFVAATLGGVAGAWQAALAGVGGRREIVLVGAACTAAACCLLSLVLSLVTGVGAAHALLELVVVAAGALAGAWLLPTVALILSRLRGQSGQTAAEYMGALLIVAVIVAALLTFVPSIGTQMSSAIDAIIGGNGQPTTSYADDRRPETTSDPTADDDGDGLTNEEEAALGTDPDEADSDGDGTSDTDEFEHGTDPNQGIDPLTQENAFKPWERLGISEDEWNDLVESILDEINPGGWKGFLFGDAAESIILDENGELVLVPPGATVWWHDGKLQIDVLMENGVGGGLVKGLAKILGAGGKSASTALKNALAKLSPSLRAQLASSGLLKGVEGAAETAKALPRFQPGRWLPHFEKHAGEFGYRTPVEYLKGARDLTGRSGVNTFTRSNGDKLFYDSARNEFAVLKPDGILRTYFRPKEGIDYWLEQLAKG
jgi:Bacterial TSP3 repeat